MLDLIDNSSKKLSKKSVHLKKHLNCNKTYSNNNKYIIRLYNNEDENRVKKRVYWRDIISREEIKA